MDPFLRLNWKENYEESHEKWVIEAEDSRTIKMIFPLKIFTYQTRQRKGFFFYVGDCTYTRKKTLPQFLVANIISKGTKN